MTAPHAHTHETATRPSRETAIPPGYSMALVRQRMAEREQRLSTAAKPDPGTMSPAAWHAMQAADAAARWARLARLKQQAAEEYWEQAREESRRADMAAAAAKKLYEIRAFQRLSIETIQRAVAKRFGVTMVDILSARRGKDITKPRQICCYLARHLTPRSLPEIGRRTGGRDHTTIIASVRKIEALRERDPVLAEQLAELERMLRPDGGV